MKRKCQVIASVFVIGVLGWLLGGRWQPARAVDNPAPSLQAAPVATEASSATHASRLRRLRDFVAVQSLHMMPPGHRAAVESALIPLGEFIAAGTQAAPAVVGHCPPDAAVRATLAPIHRSALETMLARKNAGATVPFLCFAPDTPEEIVTAFNEAMGWNDSRANLTSRWSSTATDGGGLGQGQPTTLTYSFVPDGTFCPNITGFSGNSDLFAYLNGIYGAPATWQAVFAQVFARWEELSGLNYVHEPNDDGVQLNSFSGVLGVRGDLRIAGIFLDGASGVLAYNNFPQDGDMVIDTGDNYFTNTANNSRRLRNVAAHEHGHGMGLLHVCPVLQTKLMEPFVTTIYDGPRHDDIRGAQRHYGDPFEPDNAPADATDIGALTIGVPLTLGTVPAPAVANSSILSIDANGEQDYFRFTVNSPLTLTVTVTPQGTSYDSSVQSGSCGLTGNCCDGNIINSVAMANLNVQVIDQNGVTVLATAAAAASGSPETISDLDLFTPGNYYVRVYEGDSPSEAQLYTLVLSAVEPPFVPLTISLPNGAPSQLPPGAPTPFGVTIAPGDEILTPASPMLHYRYSGGAFTALPLTPAGGNNYTATLPAADCADAPEFYVSAVGDTSGEVTSPPGGAGAPYTAIVTSGLDVVFADNFELNQGWTVSGDAADGHWQRGDPVNLNRGDPASDSDGSGQCFLTDNDPLNSNSDVDDGSTILTSPVIDLSQGGVISYDYWLNDVANGLLNNDALTVEVATDAGGTNWTTLRTYTTAQAAWRSDAIDVGTEVPASATIRVRFTASDLDPQNVVECGVDAFLAEGFTCESTGTCADGIQNQGEDRIDCGGPCPACECTGDGDCGDGLFCNGAHSCDAFGACQDNGVPCAGQSCRESDDACIVYGDGDHDADGDVDLKDYAGVQACFGAEAFGACERVNLSGDAVVDDADAADFVPLLNGPQ